MMRSFRLREPRKPERPLLAFKFSACYTCYMALGMKFCNRSPGARIELAAGCQTFSAERGSFQVKSSRTWRALTPRWATIWRRRPNKRTRTNGQGEDVFGSLAVLSALHLCLCVATRPGLLALGTLLDGAWPACGCRPIARRWAACHLLTWQAPRPTPSPIAGPDRCLIESRGTV